MRFGRWAAVAAGLLLCAGDAQAARYYEFEVQGLATLDNGVPPAYQTSALSDDLTFYIDTQTNPLPGDGYGTAVDDGDFVFFNPSSNGTGHVYAIGGSTGPVFDLTFQLSDIPTGDELGQIDPNGAGFQYREYITRGFTMLTEVGSVTAFYARTTDIAPASLAATDRVVLTPVPELATWAMTIFGVGMAGYQMRQRRRPAGRFLKA